MNREFSVADPAPKPGPEPELTGAPESAHAGLEATSSSNGGGMMGKVRERLG